MTAEDKAKLEAAGYDVASAITRFANNEMLFEMFLKKVPGDAHYTAILPSIEAGDYDQAHKDAHAIKGVVGNLGINPVFDASAALCTALKQGTDAADIKSKYDIFASEYDKASNLIASLG